MKKVFGFLALILIVMAVVFGMDVPQALKYKRGDIKNFNSEDATELAEGDLVQGRFEECWGAIAEREETNTVMGIKTSSRTTMQYYVIYNEDTERYVLYGTGNSADYTILDRMETELDRYIESVDVYLESGDADDLEMPETTIQFTGEVKPLSSDLREIFKKWYEDGFEEDCEMYMITHSNFERFDWVMYAAIGCAAGAVLMFVLMLVIGRKQKQNQQYGY